MRDFFEGIPPTWTGGRCERRARKRARRFMKHVARAWAYRYPVWMGSREADEYLARRSLRRMWLFFAMIEGISRLFGRRAGGAYEGDEGWQEPVSSRDWWPSRSRVRQPREFLPRQSAPIVSRATVE